jgi:hypothetical protein
MAFAESTKVAVEKSTSEIRALLRKHGADRIAVVEEPGSVSIQCFLHDRLVRFRVRMPSPADLPDRRGSRRATSAELAASAEQRARQRARALLLVIKAKLESVESEVETFEEAFLANVVLANGETVMDRVREPIALEYKTGAVGPLLLEGPRRG